MFVAIGLLFSQAADAARDFSQCGTIARSTPFNDYRLRASTPTTQWGFDDNMRAHTNPAIQRIRAGEYSHRVMADLNFTLRGWPNHLPALRALIDYAIGGGKAYEFLPFECYFVRARQVFPDDVNVVLAEAYYVWKTGDKEEAKGLYESALKIAPDSADVHYNLGLLLVELGDYEQARVHAQAAYAAGHPLQGLRNKLAKAGYPTSKQAGPPNLRR